MRMPAAMHSRSRWGMTALSIVVFILAIATPAAVAQLGQDYEARAFECDKDNNGMSSSPTKLHGSTIRICIEPTQATIDKGVYILKINNFQFTKDDTIVQDAVKNGADADETQDFTQVTCRSGASLCVIEAQLKRDFYTTDGRVTGSGEVAMQFGSEPFRRNLRITTNNMRTLQIAGTSDVEMVFFTSNGKSDTEEGVDDAKNEVSKHWKESEPYMRFLYVMACIVLFLLLLCLCLGCCFWEKYCGRESRTKQKELEQHDDRGFDDQFMDEERSSMMYTANQDDPSMMYNNNNENPYDYNSRGGDDNYSYADQSQSTYPDPSVAGYNARSAPGGVEVEDVTTEGDSDYESDDDDDDDDDEDDSSDDDDDDDDDEDAEESEEDDDDDEDELQNSGQMVPFVEKEGKAKHKNRGAAASVPESAPTDDETESPDAAGAMVPYEETETKKKPKRKKKAKKNANNNPQLPASTARNASTSAPPPDGALVPYDGDENGDGDNTNNEGVLVPFDGDGDGDAAASEAGGQLVVSDPSDRQIVTKKKKKKKNRN
eukprot:CAMPEP_0119545812 /NCGR_PEP_ID=MMETSP1352-20130426/458_1 /TAXON_ID=265584 /ORGANISM="Stauroneis constricta, Strain CCMP1120" /LENGTH=544 /DNA_ID=CAMNT_0007590415 /DNA_START=60 /DNA_END=1694 /DNA_ORIENTATION=-